MDEVEKGEKSSDKIETPNRDDVLLVYPFRSFDGETVEESAKALFLREECIHCSMSWLLKLQETPAAPCGHFLTMSKDGFDCLKSDVYLDDAVIDFWLRWITEK